MNKTQKLIFQTQYEMLADCIMELMYCSILYSENPIPIRIQEAKRAFADRMVEIERIKITFKNSNKT